MSAASRRFIFVDVLRTLAITLALAAHAINDFDIAARLATHEYVWLRLFTRAANPSFVFVFGMMLEMVYARKLAEKGLDVVMPRLLWRSVQCYVGYAVTVFAGWAMGLFGTARFVQALFFIYGGHHGNILKFYTVALLVAIPLLCFRHRYGLLAAVTAGLSVWIFGPFIDLITGIPIGRFGGLRELFVQLIPHNLTFIAGGMLVGNALRSPTTALARRVFFRHVSWITGGCLIIAGILVWQSSAGVVLHSYLDYYQYRTSYHVGYYALGLLQATTLCLILFLLFPLRSRVLSPSSPWLIFGRASLLSFTVGNVVLNVLVGFNLTTVSPYSGLGWTAAFLGTTFLLVTSIEGGLRVFRRRPTLSIVFRPAEYAQRRGITPLSNWLLSRRFVLARHESRLPPSPLIQPSTLRGPSTSGPSEELVNSRESKE